MMAVGGLIQDDNVANFVLREMHRELIQQINVDEITIHLISARMLTDAQQDALQNSRRGATDRTTYLLSNEVLGGRGFRGLSALLDALRDNQLYKPHLELAQRIETSYSSRISRGQTRSQSTRSVPVGAAQQPADPRTGESRFSISPTSCVSQQPGDNVSLGEPHHYKSTTPHVQVASSPTAQTRLASPVTDEGDVYSSCQSSLCSQDSPTTNRRSSELPHIQGLTTLTEVMMLQKHRSLKNAQVMKIILVGNSSVGKTSILQRYVYGTHEKTLPTCGAGYLYQYVYHPKKNVNVKMYLWDTMGQERHHSITSTFYKNSDAAVIVFDLTSPNSLNHVHWWHKELKERVKPDNDIPIILAGNKCDLIRFSSIRQPSIVTRARQKAFDLGLKDFIVVSARNGSGMEELFGRIVTLGLDVSNKDKSQCGFSLQGDTSKNENNSKCSC